MNSIFYLQNDLVSEDYQTCYRMPIRFKNFKKTKEEGSKNVFHENTEEHRPQDHLLAHRQR